MMKFSTLLLAFVLLLGRSFAQTPTVTIGSKLDIPQNKGFRGFEVFESNSESTIVKYEQHGDGAISTLEGVILEKFDRNLKSVKKYRFDNKDNKFIDLKIRSGKGILFTTEEIKKEKVMFYQWLDLKTFQLSDKTELIRTRAKGLFKRGVLRCQETIDNKYIMISSAIKDEDLGEKMYRNHFQYYDDNMKRVFTHDLNLHFDEMIWYPKSDSRGNIYDLKSIEDLSILVYFKRGGSHTYKLNTKKYDLGSTIRITNQDNDILIATTYDVPDGSSIGGLFTTKINFDSKSIQSEKYAPFPESLIEIYKENSNEKQRQGYYASKHNDGKFPSLKAQVVQFSIIANGYYFITERTQKHCFSSTEVNSSEICYNTLMEAHIFHLDENGNINSNGSIVKDQYYFSGAFSSIGTIIKNEKLYVIWNKEEPEIDHSFSSKKEDQSSIALLKYESGKLIKIPSPSALQQIEKANISSVHKLYDDSMIFLSDERQLVRIRF